MALNRPSAGSITRAIEKLSGVTDSLKNDFSSHNIFLVGDLNINLLKCNSYSKLYSELCAANLLYNYVNIPTRVTKSNATLLDVCASSCKHVYSLDVVTYGLSDHYLLYCIKKRERNDSNISRHKVRVRSFKNYDPDALSDSLKIFNWGRFFATRDVDVCWRILYDQILIHADFFAPFCTKFVRTAQPGWFSSCLNNQLIEIVCTISPNVPRRRLIFLRLKPKEMKLRPMFRMPVDHITWIGSRNFLGTRRSFGMRLIP